MVKKIVTGVEAEMLNADGVVDILSTTVDDALTFFTQFNKEKWE